MKPKRIVVVPRYEPHPSPPRKFSLNKLILVTVVVHCYLIVLSPFKHNFLNALVVE